MRLVVMLFQDVQNIFFDSNSNQIFAHQKLPKSKQGYMCLDQVAVHDVLVQYISPRHNLHAVCKSFYQLYASSFFRNQSHYKGYSGFVNLPTHINTFGGKLTSLIRQESFAIDISCFDCFDRIVYSREDCLQTQDKFVKIKRWILACVQRIYIDCHWVGYVATTQAENGDWIINPIYQKKCLRRNVPFDFDVYEQELNLYLVDWSNLKEVHLFKPCTNNNFLMCLYARTKSVLDKVKARMANPHHLTIVEIGNEGLSTIECIENSLLFLKNVDSRLLAPN